MVRVLVELECEDCQLHRQATVFAKTDQDLAQEMHPWNIDAMVHRASKNHQVLVSALVLRDEEGV